MNNPDKLSQLILEADALLLLLHRHRDDTPLEAITLLRRKLELILVLTDGLDEDIQQYKNEGSEYPEDSNQQQAVYTPTIEHNTPASPELEVHSYDQINIADSTTKEETIGDYIEDTIEKEPENTIPTVFIAESEPVFAKDDIDFYQEQPQTSSSNLNNETTITGSLRTTYYPSVDSTPATNPRKALSTFFNLNDKFRFRRELFGNSDAIYVECLDTLSVMSTIEEAEDYLFNDLKWDSNNDDVKAFLGIIDNYYKQIP